MTLTRGTQQGREQAADKNAIRPFHVNVPEAELTELRRRVAAARLPERETVTDFSQGVPLATTQKLARYWATEYDWRKVADEHGGFRGSPLLGAHASLRRRASRPPWPRAPSRMNFIRRRGAGRSRHIPTSSTTTSSPRAATSPPGSSRSCSRKNFAPASSRCANSGGERAPQLNAAVLHIPIAQPSAVRVPSAPGDYCFVSWKLYGPSLSRPLPKITCFPALLERVSSDFSAPATATLGPVTR